MNRCPSFSSFSSPRDSPTNPIKNVAINHSYIQDKDDGIQDAFPRGVLVWIDQYVGPDLQIMSECGH